MLILKQSKTYKYFQKIKWRYGYIQIVNHTTIA